MADFIYKGRSANGALVTGTLAGQSADAVATRLISLGVTPVEIRDHASSKGITFADLNKRLGGGQPTTKDLVFFAARCTQSRVPVCHS